MLIPRLLNATVATLAVDQQLLHKWNHKLTKSDDNPFPLAPVDLVELGAVTPANYHAQNEHLSGSRYVYMLREIRRWAKEIGSANLSCLTFEIHGAGLFRGFTFIEELANLGMEVRIRDNSSVACKNAKTALRRMRIKGCQVLQGEILAAWDKGEIEDGVTVFYYPQLVQILSTADKDRLMGYLGNWLVENFYYPNQAVKRVYFWHARHEDNKGPAEWGSIVVPEIKWADTTTYTDQELLDPAQAKYTGQGQLELTVLSKHTYYHQTYSLLRLMVKQ